MPNKTFSFIVCTYNRDKYLKEMLLHLSRQKFEKNAYEVVIINNNSSDSTDAVCRQFIRDHKELDVVYHIEKQQGLSYARNTGSTLSHGEYVVFIDDDAFAQEDYLSNLTAFLNANPDFVAGGGKIIPVFETTKPKWMSKYLYPLVAATNLKHDQQFFQRRKFPLGANMFFKKEIVMRYGPFNVELGRRGDILEGGEEKDLFNKIRKDHDKIHYVPSAVVRHIIPDKRLSVDYIRKQAIGVGKSERTRLKSSGIKGTITKLLEESIKTGGTLVLFFKYLVLMSPSKSIMLLKFRYWVLKGYFSG